MADTDTIVVFTGESVEEILKQGGTSRWRLNSKWASEHRYVICVRNARADFIAPGNEESHRSAFLMGKISELVPEVEPAKGNRPPQPRFLIKCSDYAEIDIPNLWNKGDQYPVRYLSTVEIGIAPSELNWRPMPDIDGAEIARAEVSDEIGSPSEVVISKAKAMLAKAFGVTPSAIEITLRI